MNATVTKVLINTTTKKVYGVEVLKKGVKENIYVTKEVIVSGGREISIRKLNISQYISNFFSPGAVNSPQILLLSGVGPREELKKVNVPVVHDLPGVGKNLHNHVAYFINFLINDTNSAPLNWATAMEYLLFRDGLMSGTGMILIQLKFVIRSLRMFLKYKLQYLLFNYLN